MSRLKARRPWLRCATRYAKRGSLLHLPVARAGEAFARAEAECPEIDRYFTDRHHASPAGSYLIALMIAKDVFGVDPKGLPDLSLPSETAAAAPYRRQALIFVYPNARKFFSGVLIRSA